MTVSHFEVETEVIVVEDKIIQLRSDGAYVSSKRVEQTITKLKPVFVEDRITAVVILQEQYEKGYKPSDIVFVRHLLSK